MRTPSPALAAALACCAALALGAGCSKDERNASLDSLQRSRPEGALTSRGVPASRDRFIGARGRGKTKPGTAFIQLTPDVWSPFDVSIHTGLFDPAQMATADGTRTCLEIDNVGFTVFFDVCAAYGAAPDGWTVTAFTGAPLVNLPGSLFLAAPEIELRIESDDATLRFHGRVAGAGTWEPVAETPWPGQTGPLEVAFGVAPILKGTLVGFDDPSFASAAPPTPPTGAQAVAAGGNDALLEGLAAFLALDGASPDFALAATELTAAGSSLAGAQALLAALPPDGTTKKAGRELAKAAKKLAGAQQDVADQDADGATKNLGKAAVAVEKAVLRLVPQPLGGL